MISRRAILLGIVLFMSSVAGADVRLPAIISDNMMIQAGTEVPIWGWAEANEAVAVSIGKQKHTTVADAGGKWMVKLKAMKPSDKPVEMTVAGKNIINVKNILVGQVWVGSGQSNMWWTVSRSMDPNTEIQNATYPSMRLFTVERKIAHEPAVDCNGRWVECSPESVGEFSAVAYYFGRELHKELKEPVGLINASWGGTIAETWMSMEKLTGDTDFAYVIQAYKERMAKSPGDNNPNSASLLYNGMIAPIIPYGIKGALWYQGESNIARAFVYRKVMASLIEDWRNRWGLGEFPFLYVQLASFETAPDPCAAQHLQWVQLRESQLKTLAEVDNTGMAVTTDIGDAHDIHPKNKQEVGRRLALWAMAKTYGKNIEYSGPMYKGMKVDDGKVRLRFNHTEGGLVAKGGELKGFTIAGADGKFVPAIATIKKNRIIVESPDVKEPVAVRYGWWDVTTECNFYNGAGLPASPFRTDEWPGLPDVF